MIETVLTAVFSTGGIDFKTYIISCVIALPKQLFLVYTGHVFEASGSGMKLNIKR